MDALEEFIKKNWVKVTVVAIILFGALWTPTKDVAYYFAQDQIKDFVGFVIADSIKKDLEKSATAYSVKLLELEMKNIRTADRVDQRVQFWIENKWNAQISALKICAMSKQAKAELKQLVYNEQVYRALLSHAK